MNTVFKIYLSMSFSGSLLILTLFFGKRFLKNKTSRQWQYYIWLVVVLRLLLPFGPETSLLGKSYQAAGETITHAVSLRERQNTPDIPENTDAASGDLEQDSQEAEPPADNHPLRDIVPLLANHVWLIWLAVAAGMLIRKITVYQGFLRYIRAGLTPVSDIRLLDLLAVTTAQAGVKKPVELSVNPLVSSPLVTGFFRPHIVLPGTDISEKDFRYTILHELVHYKRLDIFYKWLVQAAVCLHWFNPLVYLMSRETAKACEFSCDEAVLGKIGCVNAPDYGQTLLDAMAAVGKYRENPGVVTLNSGKQLLKERLGAIMNFRKRSKAARILTGVLTLCIIFGASFTGVYPAAAAAYPDTAGVSVSPAYPDMQNGWKEQLKRRQGNQVKVDFTGISITGQGPVGVDLVRTDEPQVTFKYLNMDQPKKCTASADVVNGIMKIKIKYSASDGVNVDFGSKPKNVVRVYIPDAIYTKFNITSKQMVLQMQDFHAPVHVTAKQAGLYLIDMDISRGTYDIDITSGPLYIEADTITKDITASVNSGPLTLCFNKEPQNLYLDTTNCGPGPVDRPANWPAIYRTGSETPKLILRNDGPTTIEVAGNSDRGEDDENGKDWDGKAWDFDQDDENCDDVDWNWDDEKDKALMEEYASYGITKKGKSYYYKDQLVYVFLDIRYNRSFYTLDVNPKGTVSIKITRNKNDKIKSIKEMTQTEVSNLLNDM